MIWGSRFVHCVPARTSPVAVKRPAIRASTLFLLCPSSALRSCWNVPEMSFLVDGEGDPNASESYKDAVETLYAISYTLKIMVEEGEVSVDHAVMPLGG